MADEQTNLSQATDTENDRKWQISRRRMIQFMGAAGAASAVAPFASSIAAAQTDTRSNDSERLRRWVMVIDTDRCDGCISTGTPPQCAQYCNWGRVVPENMQWLEVYEEERSIPGKASARDFLPAPCMQCQNAPCCNVCPVGATFHNPEGVVLIDQDRCIGCRLCMAACPYDRRFFNWGEPVQPLEVKSAPYDIQTQIPAKKGTVMKCDFCTERLAVGSLPFCVEGCPYGAIYMGDLEEDIASNGREAVSLSRLLEEGNATRYKEHLGTEPRVYYLSGHGDETGHSGDEPFLNDKLEWPWEEIVAQQLVQQKQAGARKQASKGDM